MDTGSLDLKKTVNLPSTGFGMKANLPQNEPKMLERWRRERIYERIREARRGRPRARRPARLAPSPGPRALGAGAGSCYQAAHPMRQMLA